MRRYLEAYGPVTFTDVKWWTGWTVKQTRRALAANEVEEVALENGPGLVLAGDTELSAAETGGVALLPGLDSTPMGYKERDWFLGPHQAELFDTNGNIGPSVWLDGQIVGGWAQRPDGTIAVELLSAVPKRAQRRIAAHAAELETWMDGAVAVPRFRTPLERRLSK